MVYALLSWSQNISRQSKNLGGDQIGTRPYIKCLLLTSISISSQLCEQTFKTVVCCLVIERQSIEGQNVERHTVGNSLLVFDSMVTQLLSRWAD